MYFCTRFERKISGVLAQVARAFDWQSKGHEFDSHILHKEEPFLRLFFCPCNEYTSQVLLRLGFRWTEPDSDYVGRLLTAISQLGFFDV